MCGIVGSIGTSNSREIVLKGLERLEYRGYDSCGVATVKAGVLKVEKSVDRIQDLMNGNESSANAAIGHTRWATHGGVTIENAHPHTSSCGRFIMVHNGVVENYLELKEKYCQSLTLKSETDTEIILEVLVRLIKEKGTFEKAIIEFFKEVKGSFSCVLLDLNNVDYLYTFKNKTPMLIGKCDGFYTVSSDASACFDLTNEFYRLADYEFAVINDLEKDVKIFDKSGIEKTFDFDMVDIDAYICDKGDYDTFMLKEIEEQPEVIKTIIQKYKNYKIDPLLKENILESSKIYIVASGTSFNAGLILKRMIQRDLLISTDVVIGSEFGYEDNLIPDDSFFIFMSQSGETADSMVVFNNVVGKYKTLAITNTKGSQLDERCDYSMLLHASIEIAVASTKAYTANVAVGSILVGLLVDNLEGKLNELKIVIKNQIQMISRKDDIAKIANEIIDYRQAVMIGRLLDFDICQEAALKIKEVSYVNVNCYPGGELKHGPIALIDENMLILALVGQSKVAESIRSNIEEIKARNGKMITFAKSSIAHEGDDFIYDFDTDELLLPMVSTIIFQYLSYYLACELKLDVDKPRNLAKAVTVE